MNSGNFPVYGPGQGTSSSMDQMISQKINTSDMTCYRFVSVQDGRWKMEDGEGEGEGVVDCK